MRSFSLVYIHAKVFEQEQNCIRGRENLIGGGGGSGDEGGGKWG